MKIALVTLNGSDDIQQWSGLNYHIARSLEQAGATLHRIGPLDPFWTLGMRLRQRWHDSLGQSYHAVFDPASLDAMGRQARAQVPADTDVVVAVTTLVAAAMGRMSQPLVSWDDATPAAMAEYYPDFQNIAAISAGQADAMGRRAADATALAIFASDWAARSARAAYGIEEKRVGVVPFGANISRIPGIESVRSAVANRPTDVCRLLWVGVEWERKGAPLAIEIAAALRALGVSVDLALVGCDPPTGTIIPEWARVEGFVSKRTPDGAQKLEALFERAHFFLMPSHAEAYGLVYAEAAAAGVPSIAIRTGGVPTIILDGETGILEPPTATAAEFAQRILSLWRDRTRYEQMCFAAHARAEETLNWGAAGSAVLRLIRERLGIS